MRFLLAAVALFTSSPASNGSKVNWIQFNIGKFLLLIHRLEEALHRIQPKGHILLSGEFHHPL